MKNKCKKQAFTLLEIIIVIIIVGVIAGLALPRLNNLVERGRSAEGANALGIMYRSYNRFFLGSNNRQPAGGLNDLDVEITGLNHFINARVTNDDSRDCDNPAFYVSCHGI